MDKYQSGKIYKIYIDGCEDVCYIGSTTKSLIHRLATHRCQERPGQNKTACVMFFENGSEPLIKLVEDFPCETKLDLETRERYWIEQYPNCVNKNIPTQSWKERWLKNREHNLILHKQWIESNKDQQAEYKAQKRLANLEEAKKKDKESRERNKEAIAERRKEIIECNICKKSITRHSLSLHNRSKAHIAKALATQNPT
jgi:hypothetical protein